MGGSGANNGDLSKTFQWFKPSEVLKNVRGEWWRKRKQKYPNLVRLIR